MYVIFLPLYNLTPYQATAPGNATVLTLTFNDDHTRATSRWDIALKCHLNSHLHCPSRLALAFLWQRHLPPTHCQHPTTSPRFGVADGPLFRRFPRNTSLVSGSLVRTLLLALDEHFSHMRRSAGETRVWATRVIGRLYSQLVASNTNTVRVLALTEGGFRIKTYAPHLAWWSFQRTHIH